MQRSVAAHSSKERIARSFLQSFFAGVNSEERRTNFLSDLSQSSALTAGRRPAEGKSRYEACSAEQFGFTRAEFDGMLDVLIRQHSADVRSSEEREEFLDALRMDDLVLARACARGNEKAWDRFLGLYRSRLYSAALVIAREESSGRELADSVYADLFGMRVEGDGRRISKLELYNGRGSLEGWLRTVLAQEFVNRYRSARRLVRFEDAIDTPSEDGESAGVSTLERDLLAHATDAALTALSAEEQFILSAYHLDDRTLADIGSMLRVHESTISRRLEKLASALRKRIVKELCGNGITKRAAQEMLKVDVRELSIDVRERLGRGK